MMSKKQTIQDKRQTELVQAFLDSDGIGIILATMRSGKTRCCIRIMRELGVKTALVCYPSEDIRKSFEDELIEMDATEEFDITYSTYLSLHKHLEGSWDIVCFDEVDATSDAQRPKMAKIMETNHTILGMTGTLAAKDRAGLAEIGLEVISEYGREQAIEDGVVTPYKIGIIKVPLDDKVMRHTNSKGKKFTDAGRFKAYEWVIEKQKSQGQNPFYMRLAAMRVLAKSLSKVNKCKKILEKLKGRKVLVFSGYKEVAAQLGIPCYHSDTTKEPLNDFLEGKSNHLAVCGKLKSGVTIPNLEYCIFLANDSSSSKLEQRIARCCKMDWIGKEAHLYILSSTEKMEENFIKKALVNYKEEHIQTII